MKIQGYHVAATVTVELTVRDLELLDNVTSYGVDNWVKNICGERGNSYNGRVTPAEMKDFIKKLQSVARESSTIINNHVKLGIVRV